MPDLPAVAMGWRRCLFAHWPVAPERVRPLVPDALDVDVREETAWVSALPSVVGDARPAFAPAGVGLTFPQVNLRTYVRHEGRPGVHFLSLDAESRLEVRLARAVYGLPYFRADVDFEVEPAGAETGRPEPTAFGTATGGEAADDGQVPTPGGSPTHDGTTGEGAAGENATAVGDDRPADGPTYRFESVRWHTEEPPARFAAAYRPTGRPTPAEPDSLDEFLAERYRAYVVRGGTVWCARVVHRSWPLCPAEAAVHADSLFEAAGLPAPAEEPAVRYSPGVEMTVRTPFRP